MSIDVIDADPFAGIDTAERPQAQADVADDTMSIRFTSWVRAGRCKRKIVSTIETIETPDLLAEYIEAEEKMIDAIAAYDAGMAQEIMDAASDHLAILNAGQAALDRFPTDAGSASIHTKHTEKHDMANPDFKKFVFKDISMAWPRLDQPYRYNPNTEKSEPCPANAQGAGYSLAFIMPSEQAKGFHAEMKAHYNDCRTRNSKLPDFSSVFGLKQLKDEKGNPTGQAQFTAKKSAMTNDGKENKAPVVVAADHTPLADRAIWTGSKGHVRVLAFPATNPQDKSGGISLLLDAVVVTQAEYGGDGLGDDFGAPEVVDDLPKTDTPAQAAKAGTDHIAQDLDDEIPF